MRGMRIFEPKKKTHKVLSFRTQSDDYARVAQQHLQAGRVSDALHYYRLALEKDPDNVDDWMEMARLYNMAGYFERSCEMVYQAARLPDSDQAECAYGLGLNFLGLERYGLARQMLENVIEIDPMSDEADDAQDILDQLEEQTAEPEPVNGPVMVREDHEARYEPYDTKAQNQLRMGNYQGAIKTLEPIRNDPRIPIHMLNNLSLAYCCINRMDDAIAVAHQMLERDPDSVHAHSNLILFYHTAERPEEAEAHVEALMRLTIEDEDLLFKAAMSLCEMNYHRQANVLLKRLLAYKPYDRAVVHALAVSAYMTEQVDQAEALWTRLIRMDPLDTVSGYYRSLARRTLDGHAPKQNLVYHNQVPVGELMRRLQVFHAMEQAADYPAMRDTLEPGESLEGLMLWGLEMPDPDLKSAILQLMDKCEGDWVDRRLRLICLSVEQPESLRKEALGILKRRGAPEPYWAVLGSRLSPVTVTQYEPDHQLSPEEQRFVQQVAATVSQRCGQPCARAALALWQDYLHSRKDDSFPVRDDADAWVAALEMMARERCELQADLQELCDAYQVTPRQVCQAVDRITRVMEGLEEDEYTYGGPDEDD